MKNILVTGATGKQGREVIAALFASPQRPDITIWGLTRDTSSTPAQDLIKKFPQLHLIQGNFGDCPAVLKAVNGLVWGVFSVQTQLGKGQNVETEEKYGKDMVDAAIEHGVEHFVYTSVERSGDTPTEIPHFISKHNIEEHLKSRCPGSQMSYTILRPVSFMENMITITTFNKFLGALWRSHLGRDGERQFISCVDIGIFAAKAFADHEAPFYHNRAISLAGDSTSFDEADTKLQKVLGQRLPDTYQLIGCTIMKFIAGGSIDAMYRYFRDTGFSVDIEALRTEHPGLLDLDSWLQLQRDARDANDVPLV